ncbi:M48 family metallopeptidase [Boseongicola aestuarii]|uniref:TPR repeat-containing protein YfgC n=1 Tax=Boseongicola aestuarii TaxID=1470561 RepID=A0A238J4D4_9RHOB|nr:M48 family metallopeptidase [Boseongicola aestuarii]SMX25171.1 TPR repeat-containing protein YfgC precursor [Boseongicola aestuarii]
MIWPASNPSAAPPAIFCDLFDGRSAAIRRVSARVDDTALILTMPEGETLSWPLASLRTVPDQADDALLVLTTTTRALARIMIEDKGLIKSIRARAGRLDAKPPVRGRGRVFGWAAAAVASVFAIVFVLVPVMADQLARVLPPAGEEALGTATLEQIQNALGEDFLPLDFCTSQDGDAAMDLMLARIGGKDLGLPYPITVSVLDHPMVNAFALPGGQVVFFRGMLDTADSPDQIAAVLAHEIGHVVARDPTRIALRSAGSLGVLGLLFGDFAGGAVVLFLVEQMIQADYSREAEAAADAYGIALLQEANVDPGALGDLFQALLDEFGDATGIAAHFMSHPALGDRIETARSAGEGIVRTRPVLGDGDWAALKAICD